MAQDIFADVLGPVPAPSTADQPTDIFADVLGPVKTAAAAPPPATGRGGRSANQPSRAAPVPDRAPASGRSGKITGETTTQTNPIDEVVDFAKKLPATANAAIKQLGVVGAKTNAALADVYQTTTYPLDALAAQFAGSSFGRALGMKPYDPNTEREESRRYWQQGVDDAVKAYQDAKPEYSGFVQQGLLEGLESVPTSLLALGTTFATGSPNAGLAVMGATTGLPAYADARAAGKSGIESTTYGIEQGVIEALTEKIALTHLYDDVLTKTPIGKTILNQLKLEIPGEQFATLLQDLSTWAHLNPDRPFSEYVAERPSAAAHTLLATISSTVVQTGGVSLARSAVDTGGRIARRNPADTRTPPPGIREAAEQAAATVTPEDEASPLDTGDIVAGRVEIAKAEAGSTADSALGAFGMPKVGTPVTIDYGDGTVEFGTMRDTFADETGAGVIIEREGGKTLREYNDTLTDAGVRITPRETAGAPAITVPVVTESVPIVPQAAPQRGAGLGTTSDILSFIVDDLEGGAKVISDSGGVTKYGISAKGNPGIDVANLTRDEAMAIYRRKYWIADLDRLDPAAAAVGLDASINHGPAFARRIIKESGGDAGRMLQMRRAEYARLAGQDPAKYGRYAKGWENRLAKLEARIGGAPAAGGSAVPVSPSRDVEPMDLAQPDFGRAGDSLLPEPTTEGGQSTTRIGTSENGNEIHRIRIGDITRFAEHSAGIGQEITPERQAEVQSIKDYIKENGRLPGPKPIVEIDTKRGTAQIRDGNHRTVLGAGINPELLVEVEVRRRDTKRPHSMSQEYRNEFDASSENPENVSPARPAESTVEVGDTLAGGVPLAKAAAAARGDATPAPRSQVAVDMLKFIARSGGIAYDGLNEQSRREGARGHDLRNTGALASFVPGAGPLLRPNGLSLDQMGEKLWEAGYFGSPEVTPRPDENEVLRALEDVTRTKEKRYSSFDDAPVPAPSRNAQPQDDADATAAQAMQVLDVRQAWDEGAARLGLPPMFQQEIDRFQGEADAVGVPPLSPDETDPDVILQHLIELANRNLDDARADAFYEVEDDYYQILDDDFRRVTAEDQGRGEGVAGQAIEPRDTPAQPRGDEDGAQGSRTDREAGGLDSGAAVDPAIAERQRKEAQLRAEAPLRGQNRTGQAQDGTMGMALFDQADQPQMDLAGKSPAIKPETPAPAPSQARVEDTGTGKSVAIIGASEAQLAAVAAAIPNAKPVKRKDGATVYSKKYADKIRDVLAGDAPLQKPKAIESKGAIGQNSRGQDVFEDENGVRSVVERGIRLTEPVEMRPTRDRGYVLSVDVTNREDRFKTADEIRQSKPDQEPTPSKPADYGANNRLVTQERAEELRKRLKEKLNRLNAGIDPEILAIGTELAVFHIEAGARRFRDLARAIAADLDQPVADLRRYLRGWYNGARDMMEDSGESVAGMDDADEVGRAMRLFAEWSDEPAAPAAAPTVSPELAEASADVLVDYFVNGGRFGSITEARAFLADLTGEKVKPGTAEAKRADETIEGAVVQAARKIASKGQNPLATYRELVDLYQRQPNLAVRSSTSVEQQAYSTPVPLAYLASQRAGINQNTTVYEPSAGNGALLIDARATYVTANELNPDRAAQLRSIYRGAQITEKDATTFVPPGGQRDVVIANPPFGVVRDATGEPLSFEMGDGYVTREIDHAISLMALDSMKNGGKAVLIVGGINKKITDPDKRADAYNGKAKREFYYRLYSEYNVTDHFTVAGELYAKQGAGWPVDVIVIEGRGKSKLKLPAVEAPRQYATWAEMEEALERGPGLHSETSPEAGDVDRTGREPVRSDGRDRGGRSAGRIDRQPERPAAGQPDRIRDGSPDREPNGGRLDDRAPSVRDRTDAGSAAVAGNRTARREPSLNRAPVAGENAHQVTYQSASGAKSLDTLVPVNMQTAVSKALDKLQDRVGGVDGFVADRLGYEVEKIADYFSAEQVDALALALDNMERGAGFIIGDQTGIGKGRVVAGVIRYALRSGRMPIFVTEKPNLYADMYRDMNDVGIPEMLGRPVGILMTNASETVPLDEEGNDVLKTPAAGKHNARLQEVADGDRDGVDVIFTTYAQMQPIKGQWTPRQQVISAMAPGSIIVFDESHNAGGQGKQEDRDKKKDDGAPNRAEFARLIAGQAHGVFFSSATYAKRPEVMDLYASTDMRLAVANIDKLAEAISKGGIPMQQVVASTLTEAGQYVRRERSFDGVEYRTPQVAVDRDAYSLFTQVLAGIQDFQEDYISEAVKIMDKEVREDAKSISFDGSVGRAGASSTNFTSVMHNIVEQMLLAMKAPAAADLAIAALEQGKKPVITAANTMGSFIEQYAEENGIGNGQPMPSDFRDVLLRYLDRTRQITVRRPFSKEKGEKVYIADHQLGAGGLAAFNAVKARIEAMDLGSVPISPFDYIRDRLAKAGYRVAEITGRSATLDYSGDTPRFRIRPGKEKSIQGRRDAITGFNSGQIDAMLLNQAGSTGLSLHASEKFEDQRPRLMIIAQAERNIDTHMQMLGRIHRTGQVVLPEYDQLVAAVPAEMRPAAVLAKKMASLNANTTGARGSAMTAEDVPDFMNEYGDEIAARLMEEDDALHRRLAEPLKESDGKEDGLKREDAARRVTGRLMLLPLDEQEAFYERFIGEYQDYLAQKEAAGEASLEAKTLDLDARTVAKQQIIGPSDESSPFGAGVDLEVLDVKRLGKPMSPDEILDSIADTLEVDRPDMNSANSLASLREQGTQWAKEFRKPFEDEFFHYRRDVLDNLDESKVKATAERIESGRQQFMELAGLLYPGATIALESTTGETIHGVVLSVDKNSKSKNPLALSTFRATFAMAEATGRMTIPFSQLRGPNGGDRPGTRLVRPVTSISGTPVLTFFGESQTEGREKRAFLTGNILAAFEHTNGKGQIVNFVRDDGSIASGLMMKRGYDHGKETARQPVTFRTPEQVLSWLDQGLIAYGDGVIVERDGDRLHVTTAASKAAGGRYFLNQRVRDALGGDFYKKSTGMVADGSYANAREIVKALQDVGARFAAKDNLDQARKIVAGEVREPKMSLRREGNDLPTVTIGDEGWGPLPKSGKGRMNALRQRVGRWYNGLLGSTVQSSDGRTVRFVGTGLDKTLRGGEDLLSLARAIPKIIEQGKLVRSEPSIRPGYVAVHRYAANVQKADGTVIPLVLLVREANNGTFHYSLNRYVDEGASNAPAAAGGAVPKNSNPAVDGRVEAELNLFRLPETRKGDAGNTEQIDAGLARLQDELRKLGLANKVMLRLVDTMNGPNGSYLASLITIARDAEDGPIFTLNHEVIHALRDMGVFSPADWALLVAKAKRTPGLMRQINRRYLPMFKRMKMTAAEIEDAINEEAVADMFAMWQRGDYQAKGTIERLFQRLRGILDAVKRAFGQQRERTGDDVLGEIADGTMGARAQAFTSGGARGQVRPTFGKRVKLQAAWHGTPHEWADNRADLGKIGTGEGAQAFGWGLYFASRREIGEHYRNTLTRRNPITVLWKGQSWSELKDQFNTISGKWANENWDALMALDRVEVEGSIEGAIETQKKLIARFPSDANRSTLAWLQEHQDEITVQKDRGSLYHVDIPEDHEYLDWNKPVNEQSPHVQRALAGITDGVIEQMNDYLDQRGMNEIDFDDNAYAGADLYRLLTNAELPVDTWGDNPKQDASLFLKDLGIAGIKYLDGGSRKASENASHNYVVFDDARVKVLEKFSLPERDDMVELGATDDTTRGKMAAAFDKWRTVMQDRYLPLLKVQREIEQQTGQALPNHLNPYLGEELMTGRIGAQLEKLSEDMVAPLFDAMAEEGINTAELESYLYARHAPERNARIAEINPDFAEGEGSGMTDLEARAIMNRIDREGKTEAMERLARRIDAIRDFSVDYRVESGLMSEEQAAEWRDTYEYYVPLRGFAETDGDPAAADKINRSGGGINVRGKESKAAYGRRSKADSPLAYLILQAEESIVRGETNRVAQRFVKLAQENPSDGFWKVQKSTAKRRINEDTGLVEDYLTHNLTAEDKDWTVSAKFDGKERRVTMDRTNPAARRLADAMRNLTQQQMDWVTLHLGKVNRFLSAVNTSYNPEFVITNAFRDLQTATINMAGLDVKGLTAGTLRDYPAALKAATKGSFGKGDGPWRDHWDAFIEAGGRVSFNQVEDVAEIKKRIEKSFAMAAAKRGDGDARLHVKRTFMAAKDLIENLNSGVENAVRLSAFKNARERGVPIEQAASIAKNLTVNFNRRGTAGPALNAAYLFFNASVQGSTRIFQAMRSPKVRKILAGVVVLGFALEILNAMTAGDDDDEENFYDKVPDYEKERNLIVMLPGGEYVKIPLPYGYNAFFGTGRSIAEIMRRGGDRWQETMGNWAGMVVDAFNPVGGTNSLLNFISPTIIDPVVDLTLNRDFADKPIMPDQPAYDSPMPDNQRYWGSVAPHWRAVTDFLNEATGGDKVVPGAIDVSPATLEYLSGVVVGAAGAFADRVAGMLSKGLGPNATLEANDLILTRKVVGEKASWYDKSAYYDRMETFDLHFDRTKDYLDAEMIDEARAYANDHVAILSLELEAKAARKAMKDVRKERKGLNHAHDLGKLTDDQYQRGMEIVKTQEDAVVKGFNTAWNRAMKQGE